MEDCHVRSVGSSAVEDEEFIFENQESTSNASGNDHFGIPGNDSTFHAKSTQHPAIMSLSFISFSNIWTRLSLSKKKEIFFYLSQAQPTREIPHEKPRIR